MSEEELKVYKLMEELKTTQAERDKLREENQLFREDVAGKAKTIKMAVATRDVYRAMLEHCGIDPNTGEPAVRSRTKTQSEQDDYDAMIKKHKNAQDLAVEGAVWVPGVSGTIAEDCVITGDKPGYDTDDAEK